MDVTLVLTHRCNLACTYCYAGEHHRARMDDTTLARAVELLWADGNGTAQLSFFGGEPFLQQESMRRAVELARAAEAAVPGRRLLLQCTTNGTLIGAPEVAFVRAARMHVVVSIDGVREAHELLRPRAGGASSFSSTYRGLRALLDGGCAPEALMVIAPASALFVFRSVRWLWDEGVTRVRANLDVRADWTPAFRDDLHDELVALGRELLHRRLRGKPVSFEPFEAGMARGAGMRGPAAAASAACAGPGADAARARVVVGTTGNLYPCSPMVGEDRAHGPEAALRLGHLDDGVATILARVGKDGASCGAGKPCACSAWLETGDRHTTGARSRWFGKLCHELGVAVATGLADAQARRARGEGTLPPPPAPPPLALAAPRDQQRRRAIVGIVMGAGGLALASAGLVQIRKLQAPVGAMRAGEPIPEAPPPAPPAPPPPVPRESIAGGVSAPPEPEPRPMVPGEMSAPSGPPDPPPPRKPPPPRPPPAPEPPEHHVDGDMIAPFEPIDD